MTAGATLTFRSATTRGAILVKTSPCQQPYSWKTSPGPAAASVLKVTDRCHVQLNTTYRAEASDLNDHA